MLIGITGRARSGKDTVASYLKEKHGFVPIAFATPLKQAAAQIFDLTDDQLYGDQKEVIDPRYGKTPRFILQFLGTEIGRAISGDLWIDRAVAQISGTLYGKNRSVVITDVRFPNEIAAVKALGGVVWKTVRPDHGGLSGEAGDHESEQELDGIDYTLTARTGEIEKLHALADSYLLNHSKKQRLVAHAFELR